MSKQKQGSADTLLNADETEWWSIKKHETEAISVLKHVLNTSKGQIYVQIHWIAAFLSLAPNQSWKTLGQSDMVHLVPMTRFSISSSGKQRTKIVWNEEGGERSKAKSFMLESSSPHSNLWHDLEMEHYKSRKNVIREDVCSSVRVLDTIRLPWYALDELYYKSERESGRNKQLEKTEEKAAGIFFFVMCQAFHGQNPRKNFLLFSDKLISTGT